MAVPIPNLTLTPSSTALANVRGGTFSTGAFSLHGPATAAAPGGVGLIVWIAGAIVLGLILARKRG